MLENIDLSREVPKKTYKAEMDRFEIELGVLQRQARELGIPIVVVFEGWDAAGKGTLINELILPLDPRGFQVHSTLAPTEDEALRPFLWKPWIRTPARGRIAIFDRSWYRRVLTNRVEGDVKGRTLDESFEDIRCFERQLTDDGAVVIKFFLHISPKEQKRRFQELRSDPSTAWRVSEADLKRRKKYDEYLAAVEQMLAETDTDHAPWTVVEAHDQRFATLKIFNTFAATVGNRVAEVQARRDDPAKDASTRIEMPTELKRSILDGVDLNRTVEKSAYKKKLKKLQKKIRRLEHEMYIHRVPVLIMYEGWDAAGKGGNIRRLTRTLDPRGYEVVPVAAPNDIEKAHHYLWRFWTRIPKAGHMTIFDRSWYGRVLVERVEGFCTPQQCRRAFREINEVEQHLVNFGMIVLKFWLQIDREEQLRRFEARQETDYKRWKITEEDWRNREKWELYKPAVEEMLFRTSTPEAEWTIVESNCKRYARLKVLQTVCDAIEQRLDEKDS